MSQVKPTTIPPKPLKTPKARKGLRRVSAKRAQELQAYAKIREWWLKEHPYCECGFCMEPSVEPHHKAGRRGWLLCDVSQWLAVCRRCHDFIESNKNWARKQGYITYV